jgi:hypothetical protein
MRSLLLVAVLGLTAAQARAEDAKSIIDSAKLFGKDAIARATQQIAEIRQEYRIDLVIETVTELPPESPEVRHAWLKWSARNKQLHRWAQQRADKLGVDGVYVVIFSGRTSAQRDVRVVGWPAPREVQVSWVKRNQIRKLLAHELGSNPDRALRHAVDLFREQMHDLKEPEPSPLPTEAALLVVGGLVGAWLLLLVVRSRVARRAVRGGPSAALYHPALLGAMFGVPAAFWVHDQLFRVIPPEGPVEELPSDLPAEPPEPAVPSAPPQAAQEKHEPPAGTT